MNAPDLSSQEAARLAAALDTTNEAAVEAETAQRLEEQRGEAVLTNSAD